MQPPQPPHGGPPPSYGPPPGPPGPPGWGPPGPPRPPNGNPAALIIVLVAVFVVLIGGGVLAVLLLGSSGSSRPTAITRPTIPDVPTYSPPTYSPPTLPSSTPSTPDSTYSPPPRNYGAIAVASNGAVGKAWDYDTEAGAKRRALNECPASGCKVLTTFVNGCGAVAFNSRTNRYWGGSGATKEAAQRNAISNAGGGRWISWVCTTR
ncbi:DUF4189 domain-containing protein [Actinomadura macrotermitis]|uniref:DUF4189 domain-containing protein n=1 Tax=Actinomadura macrotermitis TaxID=2585200 RepID=A0A7K0BVQ1_9ACTN|nr:DUF4189 domain-containing protein [Actinomadura macrotermitis]MQY04972.1 hypothetical protein [Actinomadura macrotermitis]